MKQLLKKYIIPHAGNNHRPHILKTEATLVILGVVLFMEVLFLAAPMLVFRYTNFFAEILPNVLIDSTNVSRQIEAVPPLEPNELLQQAAQMKANDMAAKGYFAHTSPEGVTPWHWFDVVGYSYRYAGENLAVNFFDSQDVAQAWMNSPTHRANVLNKNFTQIGIATARGMYQGREAIFVAELFGKPALKTVQIATPVPATPAAKPEESKLATVAPAPILTVNPQETAVAVKGAESDADVPLILPNVDGQLLAVPQYSSLTAKALASPRAVTNYFYLMLFTIICTAVLLKLFIKMHPDHHDLVFNGVLMMLIIASAMVLNQYTALGAAGIL